MVVVAPLVGATSLAVVPTSALPPAPTLVASLRTVRSVVDRNAHTRAALPAMPFAAAAAVAASEFADLSPRLHVRRQMSAPADANAAFHALTR